MSTRALQNLVGGTATDAADGATIDLVDPSTGEVFATSPRSGAADVDAACSAAADRLRDLARHHARASGSWRC